MPDFRPQRSEFIRVAGDGRQFLRNYYIEESFVAHHLLNPPLLGRQGFLYSDDSETRLSLLVGVVPLVQYGRKEDRVIYLQKRKLTALVRRSDLASRSFIDSRRIGQLEASVGSKASTRQRASVSSSFSLRISFFSLSLILVSAPFSPMSESRSWHQHLLAIRFPYPSLELCQVDRLFLFFIR